MKTVTVSSEYTVEIPPDVREELGIEPGQEFHVLSYDGRIEFIRSRPIEEMREPDRVIMNVVDSSRWTQDADFAHFENVRFRLKDKTIT